jgi:hypothetical protein
MRNLSSQRRKREIEPFLGLAEASEKKKEK